MVITLQQNRVQIYEIYSEKQLFLFKKKFIIITSMKNN